VKRSPQEQFGRLRLAVLFGAGDGPRARRRAAGGAGRPAEAADVAVAARVSSARATVVAATYRLARWS
jgi:hypothetical protein